MSEMIRDMDSAAVATALQIATALLGDVEFVADHSWPHGESVVLEVRSPSGNSFMVKRYAQRVKFVNEVDVYQRWVPAIDSHAPTLVAHDDSRQTVVLIKEAGDVGVLSMIGFRNAGAVLRRFHAAAEPEPLTGFAAVQRQRFETWAGRARPGLATSRELDVVECAVDQLTSLPEPAGVPCHRDWQPRNWLTTSTGDVCAIDFEHARLGPWVEDLVRMWNTEWIESPDLGRSFMAGYGRPLNDDDRALLRSISTLWLFTTIVWADLHDDHEFGDSARRRLHQTIDGASDPI